MAAYSAIAGRVGYAGAIRGLRRAGVQTGISLTAGHGEGSAVMNMHPMGDPSGTLTDPQDHTTITALRQITAEQLRHLGTHQVVYLKVGTCDGEQAFVVFGANGTPLVVVEDVETAVETVAKHGLGLVTLH